MCVGIVNMRLRAHERAAVPRDDAVHSATNSAKGAAAPAGATAAGVASDVDAPTVGAGADAAVAGRRRVVARLPAHLMADVVSMLTMAPFDAKTEARALEALKADVVGESLRSPMLLSQT